MAMVVKNNMSAVRTLATLNTNNTALQESLSKVASGLKINSAKDDASGYAISERMRVQIRSLDQANQNTQNASSLMKNAEGAVERTVEILRTLKRKAIDAATDTNTDDDRATIQKELDQFIDQIDDNALITFNGKYLLEGSRAQSGNAVSTHMTNSNLATDTTLNTALVNLKNRNGESIEINSTDKVTVSFVMGGKTYTSTLGSVKKTTLLGDIYQMLNTATNGTSTADTAFAAIAMETDTAAFTSETDKFGLTVSSTGLVLTNDIATGSAASATTVIKGLDSNTIMQSLNGLTYDFDKLDGSSTYSLGTFTYNIVDANGLTYDLLYDITGSAASGTGGSAVWQTDKTFSTTGDISGTVVISTTYKLNLSNIVFDNTTYNIGEMKYDQYTGTSGVSIDQVANTLGKMDFSIDSNTWNVEFKTVISGTATNGATLADVKFNDFKAGTGEDSITKVEFSGIFSTFDGEGSVSTDTAVGTMASGKALTTADGKNALTFMASNTGLDGQISGFSIAITDSEGNMKKSTNTALDAFKTTIYAANKTEDGSVSFQIGASANQAIKVGLMDMRSEALGLKGRDGTTIKITTREAANAAVSAFDNALNKALDQQTTIGAISARLEYTASNLTTSSENVQAAESTIRDADMAKEMTNYTKNNVLLQAAQSMLAQANQNSSAVLSLLQ